MAVQLTGLVGSTVKAWKGAKAEPYRQSFELPPGTEDLSASISSGAATLNTVAGEEAIAFVLDASNKVLRVLRVCDGQTRSVPGITSLTPSTAVQDTGPVTVTVLGTNFTDSTEVLWDSQEVLRFSRLGSDKLVGIVQTTGKTPATHRIVVANAGARSPGEPFIITPTP
jgi:hypothetical protein